MRKGSFEMALSEAAESEFKSALETKKPKSWLKTVSAFANGIKFVDRKSVV